MRNSKVCMVMAARAAEFQKAVFQALGGDAPLVEALGGPRIYVNAPANVAFPHITFGRTSVLDWSTGAESATEHLFTLHIWSKAPDGAEAEEIMERARYRLAGQTLLLEDGAAVGMHLEFAEVRYDENMAIHHGMLRFRAVIDVHDQASGGSPGDAPPTA